MTVILRKLTEKSVLDFGAHEGYRVGDLMKTRRKGYLVWVYYHCSNITFTDEILDKLGIETKIDKPGKNHEIHKKWKEELKKEYGDDEEYKRKVEYGKKRQYKFEMKCRREREKIYFSKGRLMSRNHVHI